MSAEERPLRVLVADDHAPTRQDVRRALARWHTTAEIAGRLVLSPSAVRAHITSIVRKLQVADRTEAAALFRDRSRTNSSA
jgi:DNA-binding NarL/FixJ family response regulator